MSVSKAALTWEKSLPVQASSSNTRLNTHECGCLHICEEKSNIFLPLAPRTLFGHEEMWTGTVCPLPSWTVACTNKWSERATQRMG